jgi:primosomal protein N' (replication factor Y)
MRYYEVAVAAPLYQSLTYGQPEDVRHEPAVGIRVLVPLGNRLVTGYLLGTAPKPAEGEASSFSVKPIADLLDPDPLFPAELVPLFRWLADYYHYPLGEVIKTALPGGLVVRSGREIFLTEAGRRKLPAEIEKVKKTAAWMTRLLEKEKLPPGTAGTIWRKPAMRRLVLKWRDAGWIEIREVVLKPGVRAKTVTMVGLAEAACRVTGSTGEPAQPNPDKSAWPDRSGKTQQKKELRHFGGLCGDLRKKLKPSELKTLQLLESVCRERILVPRPELTRHYRGAGKALRSLAERGLVVMEERRCYRDPFGNVPPFFAQPETLTQEQQAVLEQLLPVVEEKKYQPFLLFGVTGCGKTEVYLQAAARCLERGRTVLVLVPEIALASQLEAHFYSRFGDQLAVLHSGLSAGEKFDQWQRIVRGRASVVIGARSAVFAPLEKLGLVIVDEEHEPAYKQDHGLRYNGRDIAVLRARFADCPVLLGSATPSVTSFFHGVGGKYTLLTMETRVNEKAMPTVEVVDLAQEHRSRPDLFFSDKLVAALHENMEKRLQSLLFVNRRGYSSFMLCRDCGHIIQCRHCHVSLTHHRKSNRLTCHYCGYSISPDITCPECRSGKLTGLGVGSERIEDEVRQLIPHARIARLDSDTTADRRRYLSILKQVRNHDIDILIGTQMVAKGLHFPRMTLVGVVWADSGLGMPDYKASERTFQLLTQVTGRAGREEYPGRVIIQTHQPAHYAVDCARSHEYRKMYDREITLRKPLGYPPFGRLVNIGFSGEREERVAAAAVQTGTFLRRRSRKTDVVVLGPAPAPLSRIKKRYRWQLLLKSSNFGNLHAMCDLLIAEKSRLVTGNVHLTIDVDPENMM